MSKIFKRSNNEQTQQELQRVLLAIDEWATKHEFANENSVAEFKEQINKDFNDPNTEMYSVSLNDKQDESKGSAYAEFIDNRFNLTKDVKGLKFWHVLVPVSNGFHKPDQELSKYNLFSRSMNEKTLETYQLRRK